MEDVLEHFKKVYPDEMVLEPITEFDRLKLAGKVELINEMVKFIEDEYSVKLGKSNLV